MNKYFGNTIYVSDCLYHFFENVNNRKQKESNNKSF